MGYDVEGTIIGHGTIHYKLKLARPTWNDAHWDYEADLPNIDEDMIQDFECVGDGIKVTLAEEISFYLPQAYTREMAIIVHNSLDGYNFTRSYDSRFDLRRFQSTVLKGLGESAKYMGLKNFIEFHGGEFIMLDDFETAIIGKGECDENVAYINEQSVCQDDDDRLGRRRSRQVWDELERLLAKVSRHFSDDFLGKDNSHPCLNSVLSPILKSAQHPHDRFHGPYPAPIEAPTLDSNSAGWISRYLTSKTKCRFVAEQLKKMYPNICASHATKSSHKSKPKTAKSSPEAVTPTLPLRSQSAGITEFGERAMEVLEEIQQFNNSKNDFETDEYNF